MTDPTMTSTTAAAWGDTEVVSFEDLKRALDELAKLPPLSDWMLIDPSGCGYRGTVAELMGILARHHPLMQPIAALARQEDGT